jgi:biopolymer transport protein ExbD
VLIRDAESESSIHLDFVPMVDVLFNLLVFFLLATSIKQAEREMSIALPGAAAVAPISMAMREILVNVDQDGGIIVNAKRTEPEALRELIAGAVGANPEQKVSVRGDRRTAYENIVRVLDICKGSGVQEPYLDTVLTP